MVIGIENAGFTSLGTGVAKTQIGGASVVLPEWVNTILTVMPQVNIDVQTANESVLIKATLESDSNTIQPFEVLCAPIGSPLGATSNGFISKIEKYGAGMQVKGGSKIDCYETALVANTATPTGSVSLVITDGPAGFAQRRSKLGTLTGSGTTASADVAGTAYQFTSGNRIVELMGIFAHTTVAAASAVMGYIKFTSSEFQRPTPLKLPIQPVGSGLSTLIQSSIDGVSRMPVDIPVKFQQVTINDYLFMGLAPTVAGNFISGVIYE